MSNIDAILIAGPTASGKSAYAIKQAQKHNGIIINTDSMQIYRELRVLTARPSKEEEAEAPHALYGTIPGKIHYSVGHWVEDIKKILEDCKNKKRLPIFTGGTGLYFSALLKGLSPVPEIPEEIRNYWRQKAKRVNINELHETLKKRDPIMAQQLNEMDTQRITRALEVIDATDTSLAEWQKQQGTPLLKTENLEKYVIAPEREILYERCNSRFDTMVREGALEEVKALLNHNLDEALPIMRALGVKPFTQYLTHQISLDQAIEQSKQDTRRYAKRQMTWLRSNMITWKWLQK